jgi:hypothetical protein
MKKLVTAAIIATMAIAQPASAAVTFDATNGTGFVGKGDVQLALGWNNATLQRSGDTLRFTFTDQAEYDVYCSKEVGGLKNPQTNRNIFDREQKLRAQLTYDARVRNQITGFNITGFDGDPVITGGVPACPAGWDADPETAASNGADAGSHIVLVSSSGGQLKVNTRPL